MDNYQAIYDAIRSRFHCDPDMAIRDALNNAFGNAAYYMSCVQQDFSITAADMRSPSVLMRPSISIDGNQWCALYGENLQDGVGGFGKSPAEAMTDFDKNWHLPLRVHAAQP